MPQSHAHKNITRMGIALIVVAVIAGLLLLFFPPTEEPTVTVPTIVNMGTEDATPETEEATTEEVVEEESQSDFVRGKISAKADGSLTLHVEATIAYEARDITVTVNESTRIERLEVSRVRLPGQKPEMEITEITFDDLVDGDTIVIYNGESISDSATEITASKIELLR